MTASNNIAALRTICEKVPEARVIVLSCCQAQEPLQPALAAEPVNYVLKEVQADQLADALREVGAGQPEDPCPCVSSHTGDQQAEDKRTVVILRVED